MVFAPKASCQLDCLGIDEIALKEFFKASSVDFSESYAQAKPCPSYLLKNKEESLEMFWEVCESSKIAELKRITKEGVTCNCQ